MPVYTAWLNLLENWKCQSFILAECSDILVFFILLLLSILKKTPSCIKSLQIESNAYIIDIQLQHLLAAFIHFKVLIQFPELKITITVKQKKKRGGCIKCAWLTDGQWVELVNENCTEDYHVCVERESEREWVSVCMFTFCSIYVCMKPDQKTETIFTFLISKLPQSFVLSKRRIK